MNPFETENCIINVIDDYATIKNNPKVSGDRILDALKILDRNSIPFYTDTSVTKSLSFEELICLESKGIICSVFTCDKPYGSYAGNYFNRTLDLATNHEVIKPSNEAIFRFVKPFDESFSISTRQEKNSNINWENIPFFENSFTRAQGTAYCTINADGEYVWQPGMILPDGYHIQPTTSTSEQYAQSCFEGMIGMTNNQGQLTVLRAADHAKRFRSSCQSLSIPAVDEEMFLALLESTLLANKSFWPPQHTEKKLYIRPFAKGLDGGDAIRSARSFVFIIQVFPINLPVNIDTKFNIVGMEGKRRSHEGGLGTVKASSNYAQTITDREQAKKGLLSNMPGVKFDGVFYFSLIENGMAQSIEVLDEMASGNLIFIKCKEDQTEIITPSLDRGTILSGTVRDSILQISRLSGYKIIEKELTFEEIKEMDLGFISGSALGLISLGYMSYKGETVYFSETKNERAITVFQYLYHQLLALRKGSNDSVALETFDNWISIYG